MILTSGRSGNGVLQLANSGSLERRGLEWAVHTFDARYHSSVHTRTLIHTHVHTRLHSAMRSW